MALTGRGDGARAVATVLVAALALSCASSRGPASASQPSVAAAPTSWAGAAEHPPAPDAEAKGGEAPIPPPPPATPTSNASVLPPTALSGPGGAAFPLAAVHPSEAPAPGGPARWTPSDPDPPVSPLDLELAAVKGWRWMVDKLEADGVPSARTARAFADPRVPPFDGLFFNPDPTEPKSIYRGVLAPRSVAQARACRGEYARAFDEAEARTGVPAAVVAAILHVETRCGRNTGQSIVLFGLARLAMANEPRNLERNLERHSRGGALDPVVEQKVRARAAKLEEMFYPEVRAVFELADGWRTDPLSLRGSPSGAFGTPQFLPTSYLRFGADGNGDGRVDLYDVDDAANSAAWYLARHGWEGRPSRLEQRRVIWYYNRSEAYIDAVLDLAERIDPQQALEQLPVAAP